MLAMEQVEPQDAALSAPTSATSGWNDSTRLVPAPRGVQVARKALATV
jgi:hypothetical protein